MSESTQDNIDCLYDTFCEVIKGEMDAKLPKKTMKISSTRNKKSKRGKPWWSDELNRLWNLFCDAENSYIKAEAGAKRRYKADMKAAQKTFDQAVQRAKRRYWYEQQTQLEDLCQSDSSTFWKNIGSIGIASDRRPQIPPEVLAGDLVFREDEAGYLQTWKDSMYKIVNPVRDSKETDQAYKYYGPVASVQQMDKPITIEEVENAMKNAKKKKAQGVDNIPADVLLNSQCKESLLIIFNECFTSGLIPTAWRKGIMNPILKGRELDARDPNNYRFIAVTCGAYKLYCQVLLTRLQIWCEENNIVCDEQNGFRKDRGCTDQLLTLTNIILSRKHGGNSVFACYIDFSKAYDRVDRDRLWNKLSNIGVGFKFLQALQGIYKDVKGTVRINGRMTQYFDINSGLKQGCLLSPTLFNIYINDFITGINDIKEGIRLDGDTCVSVLAYADDLVLLSTSAEGLQKMLDYVSQWCDNNAMKVNCEKTKIMHFRKITANRSNMIFTLGHTKDVIEMVSTHKYLGLHFNEYMDFNYMAKYVAQSANRSLGLLIAKYKATGGMPYKVYTSLYNTLVDSVIRYGSAIWGFRSFSCISAVQNRASRFFLGVGKYTPNAAVQGDIGWYTPLHRQWLSVTRMWIRVNTMPNNRINYKAHAWARRLADSRVKNWTYHVCVSLKKWNLQVLLDHDNLPSKDEALQLVSTKMEVITQNQWYDVINSVQGRNAQGGNKLRTYRIFKEEFGTEDYLLTHMPHSDRSALAKFRCGTAPIRIETGRYQQLSVNERLCPFQCGVVETEAHVLAECQVYEDLRHKVWQAARLLDHQFDQQDPNYKLRIIMTMPDIKHTAVLCKKTLKRRRSLLFS